MARVASNNRENSSFMDPLTHAVIKETSKSLKYYIDVKRRENGFILNPNSSAGESVPLKARFIYGTAKEYPPLYGSYHSDSDVKLYLRTLKRTPQKKDQSSNSKSNCPEKQMCRKELNYHMRSPKYASNSCQKFSELRLGPAIRPSSSCSRLATNDSRRSTSKSAFKSPRTERDQLIDDTAGILATMIKTRRSVHDTNYLSQQIPPSYDSRNANPSPRLTDEQSNRRTSDVRPFPTIENFQQQTKTDAERNLEQAATIMFNAKPITNSILCDYKVTVRTGNCNGASTNAPIRIKFYGTHGHTNFNPLTGSETHRVPFLKDQTDIFTVQTDHAGQLVGITIGHDKKDIQANWFLNHVSIEDSIRDIVYEIPCNSWLSSTSIDQKTMRDFQVTSMRSFSKNKISHKRRDETDSQSSSSSTTTARKNPKSIEPTTIPSKRTSIVPMPIETQTHRQVLSESASQQFRSTSPPISSLSSSDSELENIQANHRNSSTTKSTSPTFEQTHIRTANDRKTTFNNDSSNEHPRPTARLKQRTSIQQTSQNKEETNNNEEFAFFD